MVAPQTRRLWVTLGKTTDALLVADTADVVLASVSDRLRAPVRACAAVMVADVPLGAANTHEGTGDCVDVVSKPPLATPGRMTSRPSHQACERVWADV